jgi:hypothetical protein
MAVTSTPVFVQTPKITPAAFTNSDSANTKKTIATAGSDGMKVTAVLATSTDTSNRTGQLWLTRSATSYLLGSTVVTTLAGTDGSTATANLLPVSLMGGLPKDNDGQAYLFLESGDTLQVSFTAQVTSAKEVDVVAIAANF